ncbi:MAG TPA: hypothetical protein VJN43_11005 [Bryobacteraceae bacterium]|nr:hypothetical protein [Bryobacteraceae bacterium]
MSVKYQIVLPDDLSHEMRAAAARLKVPLAQFIRETMEGRLRQMKSVKSKQRPFDWMRKLRVDIPDRDLASRVDEILYK